MAAIVTEKKPLLPSKLIDRRQNSTLLTAGILTADVVGAGILSMAVAVSRFGWLLGVGMLLMMLVKLATAGTAVPPHQHIIPSLKSFGARQSQ